jgi:hypothetical protein
VLNLVEAILEILRKMKQENSSSTNNFSYIPMQFIIAGKGHQEDPYV